MQEEIFRKFENLQKNLVQKFQIEKEIADLPKDLKIKQDALNKVNKEYIELHEQYDQAVADAKSFKFNYDLAVQNHEDSEKRIEFVTTQREFEALENEIKSINLREQDELKKLHFKEKEIAELEEKLNVTEKEMNELTEVYNAENLKYESALAELQEKLKAITGVCEESIDDDITPDLYKKFQNIVANKAGLGIVPIHGIVCQGCHMILPIQFVNDVRSAKEIEFCPYCSRILYYEDVEGAESQFAKDEVDILEGGLADFVSEDEFDFV